MVALRTKLQANIESAYSAVHKGDLGEGEGWAVFHLDSIIRVSEHETKAQARAAISRYEAADARRAKST